MGDPTPGVTIQDVAALAGVSAMTVSRVINKRDRVAPATRQRVEQVIRDLGYVPNALARGLLTGRTRTIGLIVSGISNPFFTEIVTGVEQVAQRNGYTVLLGNSNGAIDRELEYINLMLQNRVDGLLIAPASQGSRTTLDFLRRQGTPFVLLDRTVDTVLADSIEGDNIGGARQLTEHLLGLGHRRIALVNGPQGVSTAHGRLLGYQAALRAHGVEPDPALLVESDYTRTGGRRSMQQLLQLPAEQQPSAIFAGNNFLAIGIIEALREAHLDVPRDMALVCFDDVELAAALQPFLTVVAQPARTFGTIATQFLLERLTSTETLPPRTVILPPKLIVRVSCGAASSSEQLLHRAHPASRLLPRPVGPEAES
jgi:LacI family transcriptional regulator